MYEQRRLRTDGENMLLTQEVSNYRSWNSSVSVVSGWMGFVFQQGQGVLFTIASRPALGPMQSLRACSFSWVKQLWCESDHSPPSSTEVKNAWSYTSTSPNVFVAWCLIKHTDNFTFEAGIS